MKIIPLCEVNETVKTFTEANQGGDKDYYLEGICIQGVVRNKNNREYPMEVLIPEVGRYRTTFIEQERAMGELDHIDSPIVMCKNASHKILSLEQDGNNFVGKLKVMRSVPNGQILAGLMDEGIKLGVSTRGYGSVRREGGYDVVQKDYHMSTIDVVSDPSAHEAFVNAIMESKDWALLGTRGMTREVAEAKRAIERRYNRENEAKLLRLLQRVVKTF